ncbi:hypothetical protein F511_02044 [Dorcoceras hygrometricum]|uniref:Uncharacterized protein n=1 Tax=Dorcoceras hygrometricum TaxID=472368 RepID=A0A2Z7BYB8_9LAMI|nr:hypothetical protein F511_02044 [Dorcoceras hygrometricum]
MVKQQLGIGFQAEQARRYGRKTTTPEAIYDSTYYPPLMVQYRESSRSIQRAQRRRHEPNRAAAAGLGGSGMQAIFLGPNQKSSGTGVFLPRSVEPKFSKKPGTRIKGSRKYVSVHTRMYRCHDQLFSTFPIITCHHVIGPNL